MKYLYRSLHALHANYRKKTYSMIIQSYYCLNTEHKRDVFMYREKDLQIIQHQFSRSVVSDSLQPHGLQHARPPCPAPTPGVYPNSCPLSRWCHPTISSSAVPFSSSPQSFPASGSFPMRWLFTSGGQSIATCHMTEVLNEFPCELLVNLCHANSTKI